MALKAIVDDLEGVDENLRSLYREGTADEKLEGKFILDIQAVDGFNLENISGLKSSLDKERSRANEAETSLKKFGEVTPQQVKEMSKRVDALKDIDPEKEADKIVEERLNAIRSDIEAKHNKELEAANSKAETYRTQALEAKRETAIDFAMTKAGVKSDKIDIIRPYVDRHVLANEDDEGQITVRVVDPKSGDRKYNAKGDPYDPEGFVGSLREESSFQDFFVADEKESRGGSGGRKSESTQSGPVRKVTTDQMDDNIEDIAAGKAEVISG